MNPRVSVIVPAFNAFGTLARGLESVARCGLPGEAVEIVIAPDDGADYARFARGWGRRKVLPPGPVRSGAGPARNRALAAASGAFIAFLDADDSWEPGYLAATLPLAKAHGVAFGQTSIIEDGREILRLPRGDRLRFSDLGETGASFHPVLRRDWAGPFVNRPSQDVLHTVEALALAGGDAPVAEPAYRIHLNPVSATAAEGYAERVAAAYRGHAAAIAAGATRVPPGFRAAAAGVFAAKAEINAAYMVEGSGTFYAYVAARLAETAT